jgi:membrane fusion protein, heavy metal efflux system
MYPKFIFFLSLICLGACSSQKPEGGKVSAAPDSPAPKPPAAASNSMEVDVTAPTVEGRLKIGSLREQYAGEKLIIAAHFEPNDEKVAEVGSSVLGRITELRAHEGDFLTVGEQIGLVNSSGLNQAQLEFLKALSQKQLAERAVQRAQLLLKADVIGSAELQRREAEFTQAEAELGAANDELIVLGMLKEDIEKLRLTRNINSIARIVSTLTGTVLERKATIGQVVQPGDTVVRIADLSSIWLVAEIPEQSAGNIRVGQQVEAEAAAFPGQMIHGRLSYVSSIVNPETRTVQVRMVLNNPQRRFKPSMLATLYIKDDKTLRLLAPASALVREGNDDFLFVRKTDKRFELRPVTLGAEFESKRVVLEGLKPGQEIILDGAFHLNNERRRLLLRASEGN